MPHSTYMKLTDERPAETDIRLSLASHSYIYPLGITEDVLVEVAEHVYPVDFVVLDIKENERRPFILGTPFLTTAKALIKFDIGTITLRSRKSKASPRMGGKDKASLRKGNAVQPIEEQNFQSKYPLLLQSRKESMISMRKKNIMKEKNTLYLMRRSLEILRKFHWMILGGQFNQLSHVSSPLLSKPGEY
ncbi:zinc finger, CCHC-type containing protein [Tanacetum coccineum]